MYKRQLEGGAGIDTADYSGSNVGVAVSLDGSGGHGGDAEGDELSGIEVLLGSAQADTLGGGTANDTLIGGAGDDSLLGSIGADSLEGGAGFDTVDYSSSSAAVTVTLDGSAGIGGDAQGDQFVSIEGVTGSALSLIHI